MASLDVFRASLGCSLLVIQARSAFTSLPVGGGWAVLLGKDWGFVTSLACHTVWLLTSAFMGWSSKYFCCASRVAPKVSLLAQLLAEQVVPATAGWYNEACDQRFKWCWKAMAEVFLYTCGEFPSSMVLWSSALDALCAVAIWARVFILTGVRPTPTAAAAHVLLRLSLSLLVHHCQRRANFGWARDLLSSWWPQSYPQQLAAKTNATDNIFRSHTPVHSSMLCCSNPDMLLHIAAASGKDLEPVHLERLSFCGTGVGAAQPPAVGELAEQAVSAGSTQAYDLARRLVSSAGASGSDGTADGSSFTSAVRKVRVSVKIPDHSPEELAPGWDADLQINSQRRAVVLFTYIRRGCIQLVLDLFSLAPAAAAALLPGEAAPSPRLAEVAERTSDTLWGSDEVSGGPAGQSACLNLAGARQLDPGLELTTARQVQAAAGEGGTGGRTLGIGSVSTSADLAVLLADASAVGPQQVASGIHGQLLRVICSDALFAGRTLTLQVGATASLVQVRPAEAGTASCESGLSGPSGELTLAGPPPALPPDVCIRQQVVCTSNSWSALQAELWPWRRRGQPQRHQAVVVACSWDAGDNVLDAPCTSSGASAPCPELQLTVRQQSQFLPVALVEAAGKKGHGALRQSLQAALAEGEVAMAVGPSGPAATDPKSRCAGAHDAPARGPRTCLLAFTPSSSDGLAQVELSRGGMHSACPASVLLVSSPAIAYELEQLQAIAGGGLDLGAAPRPSAAADVVRDFGSFLDIIPALPACVDGAEPRAADGAGSCSQLLIEWSLAPVGDGGLSALVPCRVLFLRPRSGCAASRSAAAAAAACAPQSRKHAAAAAAGGGHGDGAEAAGGGLDEYQERRVLTLASVGGRMGLNLLRYFLSSGMAACATRVLDVLHQQFGVPAAMLAGRACCGERMTLLHHAARSGSFRTIAAVAAWLEERGADPSWDCTCPRGITPLHLLAVVPDCEASCALVQLRWPGARRAWHGSKSAGATPAEFAALARGAAAPPWWARAAGAAPVSWAVGGVWRCAARARKWLVPRRVVQGCEDIVAPALGFMLPSLESRYGAWLDSRVAFMDHLFIGIYTVYSAIQAAKDGWTFFNEHFAGLVLLAARLGVLTLHSPLWSFVQLRRLAPSGRHRAAQSSKEGRGEGVDGGDSVGSGRPGRVWLLASREGGAVLVELLRLAVMLLVAAGAMRLPHSWVRLVQMRLDLLINIVIRPMAFQMRVLPSVAASAVALLAEAMVVVAIWQVGVSAALAFGFTRGFITHGLGLGLTVLLQASARGRFLAEMRALRNGMQGSKAC